MTDDLASVSYSHDATSNSGVEPQADATETLPHGRLTTGAAFHKFLTGGNATFTLVSRKTGTRYTFRVRKADKRQSGPDRFFVSTLIGSDNERDYAYLGSFTTMHGTAYAVQSHRGSVLCAGKKGKPDDVRFKGLNWLLNTLYANRFTALPEQVEVWHEGRCARCARKLTDPASIERGFGPECASK